MMETTDILSEIIKNIGSAQFKCNKLRADVKDEKIDSIQNDLSKIDTLLKKVFDDNKLDKSQNNTQKS